MNQHASVRAPIDQDALEEFRAAARKFADGQLTIWAEEIGEDGLIPEHIYRGLADAGYLGASLPEAYGGSGIGFREYCVLLEVFSRVHSAFTLALTMSGGPATTGIMAFGTDAQRELILPGVCDGSLKVAFALTEPGAGSDAAGMKTKAVRSDGGWVLNGTKHYITYGDQSKYIQVMAVTDPSAGPHGVTAFLVDAANKGFEVARVDLSIAGDRLAELKFDDCFVPDEMVLGEPGSGFKVAMSALDEGRLGIAASCNGATERMIELGVDYAKTRTTFGKPLSERQAIQWQLVDSVIELEASRAMLSTGIDRMERGEDITRLASASKVFASEMAGRVADRVVQIHGGSGVVRGVPIERMYREVRHYRIGEGASEIQRMIIARDLLR